MGALRHLTVRIEEIELCQHWYDHARHGYTKEDKRAWSALTAQRNGVIAKLGGEPTINEWAKYQERKRNGGAS
jgi:hypothetical protein